MTYPWERKIDRYAGFYPGMSGQELIMWLRYRAIDENAPAILIDRLADLTVYTENEIDRRIEEAYNEGYEAGKVDAGLIKDAGV